MKKVKSILCAACLSTVLVGNAFAGDIIGGGAFSFVGNVVTAIVSLVGGPSDCRPRDCQTCRPDQRDEHGDCRPPSGS